MPPSDQHLAFLKDLFSPFGEITIRKMFGGAGIYCDGMIFAIADEDDVWLKVDNVSRPDFEAEGLKPFEVEMNGKRGTMSYYRPPDDIYDDADALGDWTRRALAAAARNKKPAKKSRKKNALATAKKRATNQKSG